MARGKILVGISGFRYRNFRGKFYPEGLRQADELAHASRAFASIELNGSFYSLQRPEYYARWHDAAPEGFVFAVKGSRFITHMKKLVDVDTPLANFFASGVLRLEEKLGPFLWQFPAQVPCDAPRFERFFELLPRDTIAASKLAKKHDARLNGRASVSPGEARPLRHAVEVRSPSCVTPEFIALLRRHDVALVVADTAGKFPYIEDVTADFVYVRLHGDEELYASGYSEKAIAHWAARVVAWCEGRQPKDAHLASPKAPPSRKSRDVYVYFDNDAKAYAPFDALALAKAVETNTRTRDAALSATRRARPR